VPIPSDLKIEVISEGRMPDTPRQKIAITSNGTGNYWYQEHQKSNAKITKKEFSIAEDKIEKIILKMEENDFFRQESHDSGAIDGDQVQMSATMNGKSHTVLLINYPYKKFDDIVRAINSSMPKEYQIPYNSLILDQGGVNPGEQ